MLRQAVEPRLGLDLPIEADDAVLREGDARPGRKIMRRFSEVPTAVAPPVQAFEGPFHSMVVHEARTPAAVFYRAATPAWTRRTMSQSPSRSWPLVWWVA
jgi:hypothetical protein